MTAPADGLTQDEAVAIASRIMYELLGRRWVWPAMTTTELVSVPAGQRYVTLEGRPIISVESVVIEGTTREIPFQIESKMKLRFGSALPNGTRNRCCGGPQRLAITYSYGAPPPKEVDMCIAVMAEELIKLSVGDFDSCRLPDRVTSVNREGISMTLLDPQDFLDQGRTGIEEIDQMLSRFNSSHAKTPARVFGRRNPPATRINTVQN